MKLFKSQSLLDASSFADIPRGTVKSLVVRFAGTSQAGKTMTLALLGRLRVNFRTTDIDNLTVSLMSKYNNLKMGVAEFSAAAGGAFAATIVIPFHAPWDDTNGMYFGEKDGYIELSFPGVTITEIVSGTVSIHTVEAPRIANYIQTLLQRNIQIGGAGTASQELEMSNISSLYVIEDAVNVSSYLVTADASEKINGSQAVLKAYSNMKNRVETAIDLIELDLNPYDEVSKLLNRQVKVQVIATAAVNLDLVAESFAFDANMVTRSGESVALQLARSTAIAAQRSTANADLISVV